MTVTQLINEACGESLQGELRESICANNAVAAGCKVHWIFRGSMIDLETGMHGVRWAIMRILTQAADTGLTTEEIIDAIRNANGGDKYPDETIAHNLTNVLEKSGQIVGVQRSNAEDCDRNSERFVSMRMRRNEFRKAAGQQPLSLYVKRPRKSWFIAKQAD